MRSLLDPLFNKRIFAAVCLTISVSAATYLMFSNLGLPPDLAPESAEVAPAASTLVEIETPYEHGFRRGYDAFLKQVGEYIPRPGAAARYTASYSGDDEDVSRGYVDGYHRATELWQCPRNH